MIILDELRAGLVTASAEEMRGVGARLAAALPDDATVALHGDLGVGKTTFVQGLARGLGLAAVVSSPTFNILHIYRPAAPTPSPQRRPRSLVHLDAYRLDSAHDVTELMLEDFLVSPYCLAVEWPEKISPWLPENALHLSLAIESPGHHRVGMVA